MIGRRHRRDIPTAARPVPVIHRTVMAIRTLHPPRRVPVDGARPALTIDEVVFITVPRIFWLERGKA